MIANRLKKIILAASLAAMIAPDFVPMAMAEDMPAKQAFGGEALPVLAQQPQSIGFMPRDASPVPWRCRPTDRTGKSCAFHAIAAGDIRA